MPARFCILCLSVLACLVSVSGTATAASAASKHIVCKIAYQPFASPAGAIFEVVKRDRQLQRVMERKGIALRFIPVSKGSEATEALRRGELDGTTLGDMPMIELATTTPITVIAQLKQNFTSVVAPRGTTPQDLKGKRIGNAFATTGHYALLKTLKNAGLSERDVTLVPLDASQMPDALLKGTIDAFAAWEPTPSLFIAQHPDRFSSTGRQASSAYLVISKSFAGKQPACVQQLATSLARAMRWLAKDKRHLQLAVGWNRAAMQQLSAKPPAVSLDELSRQIASDLQAIRHTARLPALHDNRNSLLADELDFLKSIGKLPKTAQWDHLRPIFDHTLMERIYRNPSTSGLNRFDYELK